MKKILIFFCATLLLGGLTYAAEDVGVMDLSFCNGLNHYTVTLDTGETTHAICMHIKNKGFQTSSISLSLVDGEFSHGDRPVQACKTNANGFFGKSVAISGESIVTLAPSQEIDKYVIFTGLPGYVGVLHGCITYSVVDTEKVATNAPMSVLTRKANLIDITVPGKVTSNFYLIPLTGVAGNATKVFTSYGKQVAGDEKIKLFYRWKQGVISMFMGIENSGFVDEDYKNVTHYSSFFGLINRKKESNVAQLYAQTNTMGDAINYVPRYNLFVKATVSVVHRPVAASPDSPQEEWQSIDYHFSFFLIPWYCIVGGLVLILFIIRLLIRLMKLRARKMAQRRLERAEWMAYKEKKEHISKPSSKTSVSKPKSPTTKSKPAAARKSPAKKKPQA